MDEFRNIGDLLQQRTRENPSKTFLISENDGRKWSYGGFSDAVGRTAGLLTARGIEKGDVVSLLMPNSPAYVIAYFACFMIGAIAGPVNSMLKPAEIEWVVRNSESKLVLAETSMMDTAGLSSDPSDADFPPLLAFDNVDEATMEFGTNLSRPEVAPDDEAVIIYTSGTTGKPKGCLLTHGNLLANVRQITEWLGFTDTDRLLTVMPLFHMNAVTVTTMTALCCGGSTVVSPKFSASRFWDIIRKYEVTSFGSVATMLSMLLE